MSLFLNYIRLIFFIIITLLGLCLIIGVQLFGIFLIDNFEISKEILVVANFTTLTLFLYFTHVFKKYDILKGSILVCIYAVLIVLLIDVNTPDNIECDGGPRVYSLGFQLSFDILSALLIFGCIWYNVGIKGSLFRKMTPILTGVLLYFVLFKLQYLSYILNPIIEKL